VIFFAEIQMLGIGASGGSTAKNFNFRFNYKRTTTVNPLSETALGTIFNSTITPLLMACLNARYAQTVDLVRFIDDAQRPAISITRAGVGLIAGDSMPMHLAAYILKRMGIRGRGAHGSNHFGPLSESDSTSGTSDVFNAAAIARWQTFLNALILPLTDANGNVWSPVVVSRLKPAQYRVNPTLPIAYALSQCLLNKRIGRMKRREVSSAY
jgi:hypothetical protein